MLKTTALVTRKAAEHTKRATELLKQSQAVHQVKKRGLLEEEAAVRAVIELNKQAIQEIDRAIELRKIYIEKAEKKAHGLALFEGLENFHRSWGKIP